ncbi:T23G5.2 [Symbiodinium sp. CCMP2592]|nr:T23G5.2 [Symbiodinium sp. CCMP2592]
MDEALARLSQSVEKELQARMESLVQQFMADSVELCRQVCKQHFAEFQHRQTQLRDAADPVVVAVTQGTGPTRDEATRQAARLLVSSAILVSATGDSVPATEPVKAPPAVSVVAPAKAVQPGPKNAVPKPMAKQALMPKPKPQDARKSITEQVMGGMTGLLGSKAAAPKAEPKPVIKAPGKAKAPESSLPVPAPATGMLSYIRKSFAGPPAPAPGPSSPPKAPSKAAELPKKSAPKMEAKAAAKAPAKPKPPQPAEPIEPTETATSLEDFETF